MSTPLTYKMLREAVEGGSVALRSLLKLQPVDGPGGKIFPPTYLPEGRESKYALEDRLSVVDGETEITKTVLIDSVASQANRAEQALLRAWDEGQISFPVPYVDFADVEGLEDLGRITVLDAPHRLADAIFRDSLFGDTLFRLSDVGKDVFEASTTNATALYQHAPTALLFGQWDSTGPRGGLGKKFQRAYVSEIVGFDAQLGAKTASRIDPLGVEKSVSKIYVHEDADQQWTMDESEALKGMKGKDKDKPIVLEDGKPSNINHGNIAPSIDALSGGVTISEARQTTVISLAGLRRLRFIGLDQQSEAAARTAIAALGVAAMAFGVDADFDLRSRCLLVPSEPQTIELVARDGSDASNVSLDSTIAAQVLDEASDAASKAGIGWSKEPMVMSPSDKFITLLTQSRELDDFDSDS